MWHEESLPHHVLVWTCFPGQHKKKWPKWKGSRNKCRPPHDLSGNNSAVKITQLGRGYSPDLCLFCNLVMSGRNQEGILIQRAYGALNCNSFIRQATSSRLMERVSTGLFSSIWRGISRCTCHWATELLSAPSRSPFSSFILYPPWVLHVGEMSGHSHLGAAVGQHQFLLDIFWEATPCSLQTSLRTEVLSHSMNLVSVLKVLTGILKQLTCFYTLNAA